MLKNIFILTCCTFLIHQSISINDALGAEVAIGKDTRGNPIVYISGPVVKGDLEQIKRASVRAILSETEHPTRTLQLHLNTPGGDLEEAMEIGRFARKILAKIKSNGKTVIAPKSQEEEMRTKDPGKWPAVVVLPPK